jgi:N-acetylglutamate synthase/N-acetylornithine aminotransferase
VPVDLDLSEQERLLHVMEEHEIDLRLDLHRGDEGAVVYFSDLTHQYVTLNAEYTT